MPAYFKTMVFRRKFIFLLIDIENLIAASQAMLGNFAG